MTLKKLFTCSLLIGLSFGLFAQKDNKLTNKNLNAMHLYELKNTWLETSNPSSIGYNSNLNLRDFSLAYQNEDGNFKKIREGKELNSFKLKTSGYSSLGKIRLYGLFEYKKGTEKKAMWTSLWNANNISPLFLGDSIGGEIDRESYHLKGIIGSNNKNFNYGVGVDFNCGSLAKQIDPRPLNKIVNVSINPGIIWNKGTLQIGLSGIYKYSKQDIEYKCEEASKDQALFKFLGFGFLNFSKVDRFNRNYIEKEYQGAFQIKNSIGQIKNISEFSFSSMKQEIEDGKNQVATPCDFSNIKYSFSSIFEKENNNNIYKLTVKGNYSESETYEYSQELRKVGALYQWFTIAKNLKFERNSYQGLLGFEYYNFKNKDKLNFSIKANCSYKYQEEIYNNIPGIFNTDYSLVNLNLENNKVFYIGKNQLSLGLGFQYVKNLDNSSLLPSNSKVLDPKFLDLYLHDHYYQMSDCERYSLSIGWMFSVKAFKIEQNIFTIASISQAISDDTKFFDGEKRTFIDFQIGMYF